MPKDTTKRGRSEWRTRNPLTHDEAAALAYDIGSGLNAESVAQLLLLVHAFTYEDPDQRESLSSAIEERLVPSLPRADEFRHDAMRRALEALRRDG